MCQCPIPWAPEVGIAYYRRCAALHCIRRSTREHGGFDAEDSSGSSDRQLVCLLVCWPIYSLAARSLLLLQIAPVPLLAVV